MAEEGPGARRPPPGFGPGGPPEKCVCPRCGYEAPKRRGVPCRTLTCPQCELPLVGGL
ncbi:MAG: hypothetical protein ACP5E9_03085 [Candidatus Methanospirareceae archaeon]